MSALEEAYEKLKAAIGTASPPGDWFTVTQEQVNQFADVTGDHQWIHVDAERAALAALDGSCRTPIAGLAGIDGTEILAVNNTPIGYGYDLNGRVFFVNIVANFGGGE